MATKLIAYGAVAEMPTMPGLAWQLREKMRLAYYAQRALIATRRSGCAPPVLFEDHSCAWFFNYGDVAIADTLVSHVTANAAVSVVRKQWQLAHQHGWLDDVTGPLLVMVCGSGYLSLDMHGRLSPRLASDIAVCRTKGAAWGLAGIGVNQLGQQFEHLEWEPTRADVDTLEELVGNAKFVSVRDKPSQRYLKRATGLDVPLTGDPALFVVDPMYPTSQPVKPSHRLQVGLSIPFHGRNAAENWNRCSRALVSALRAIQQKLDCEFHYFVHHESELFITRLLKAMGFHLTIHFGSVGKLLAGYQGIDLLIAGMLHACILAANYNVPLVGLAYDAKHQGFFDLMGIRDQVVTMSPEGLALLPDLVQGTVSNASDLSRRILAARTELAPRHHQMIRVAREQLGLET